MKIEYTAVTEVPGNRITQEALAMMYTRYAFAANLCEGKAVLEVACGAGVGLGYLARGAHRVVGGELSEQLIKAASAHYNSRMPLVRFDAHCLPFRERTFDLVILYEAIYYLSRPEQFLADARRVLRSNGIVLICTVNREWPDFNPSPLSTSYPSAGELRDLLEQNGFRASLYAAFPVRVASAKERVVSFLKRKAVALHLIPKTMKGKTVLKRIFLGKLTVVPPEIIEGSADCHPLTPLEPETSSFQFRVLYGAGRLAQ